MRVIHLIPEFRKGGAERLCIDICYELKKRKIDYLLITFNDFNLYEELTKYIDYKIVKIDFKLSVLNKNKIDLENLNRIVENFSPDIIHSHLFIGEIISQSINHNALRICHVHDDIKQLNKLKLSSFFSKLKIANYYERIYYLKKKKSNKTIYMCISKDSKSIIENKIPNSNCVFFPNAINIKNFKPINRKINNNINLISIGSFYAKKGHSLLLKTLFELNQLSNLNFKLHLIGDGALKDKLIEETKKLKLTNKVIFHGIVPNPEKYLQKSHLYVHAASYEPFGLALIEAMSTGLPVISTDGKGNRDIINENNGVLLNHRNPKKYAMEILTLIKNTNTYENKAMGALKTAKKYDIKNYVDRLLEIYLNATR
tara:strand:+ start:1100 stop:2212 length:1113 start_codon:yes stop_codon:yes gene_type:complete